jgi:hypothetical protein
VNCFVFSFFIITIIKPNLFTFLNKSWITFGILLGKIISPIILGLIFFFVVTPIGLFVRIFKKDIMGVRFEKNILSGSIKKINYKV